MNTTKTSPISVLVNWSESDQFKDAERYDFNEFEKKAFQIALANSLGGYDKTNVTVTFDNGNEHQCRLDLGCDGNDLGFTDHCVSTLNFYHTHQDDPKYADMLNQVHHQQLIQLISTYQLDSSTNQKLKAKAKKAATKAKQKQAEAEQSI